MSNLTLFPTKDITPGHSKTPGKSYPRFSDTYLGIDWLSGRIDRFSVDCLKEMLKRFSPDDAEWQETSAVRGYATGAKNAVGIRLSWGNRSDVLVQIPGSVLGLIDESEQRTIFSQLYDKGFKATRVDIALDLIGEGWSLDIHELWGYYQKGYLGYGRKASFIQGDSQFTKEDLLSRYSDLDDRILQSSSLSADERRGSSVTLCIGARGKNGGGSFTRIYSKGAQYGLREYWTRIETEFSGAMAKRVFNDMVFDGTSNGTEAYRQVLRNFALYRLDFLHHSTRQDGGKRRPLDSWADFRRRIDSVALRVLPSRKRVRKSAEWFARNLATTLYKIYRDGARQFVHLLADMLERGAKKFSDGCIDPKAAEAIGYCLLIAAPNLDKPGII